MIKAEAGQKLEGKKITWFILLCSAVYFTSYVTRINYGAVMAEIIRAEGITRSSAGVVSTVAFLTYGAGQILSGYIGDKVSPKLLVVVGLLSSSACNILMPFARGPLQMAIVWGINGVTQAFFWPPLVKLMATMLDIESYKRAVVSVSAGSSIGTIAVYLISPAAIVLAGWRAMFFLSAACGIATAVLWSIMSPSGEHSTVTPRKADGKKAVIPSGVVTLLIMFAAAIVLQGILRDGLTTWMPTFVSDMFGLSTAASILTGIALPVFAVVSFNLASLLDRRLRNEVTSAAVMFGVGAVAAGLLYLLRSSAPAAVALMAVVTGCMHGVNLMLITRVPAYFGKSGRISTVSGVLNTFTYVGSGISGFGIALVSDNLGWGATAFGWFIVALLGTLMCVLAIHKWNRFTRSE